MQTSKKKIPAGLKCIILVLVLLLAGNSVLNYVLTPYRGSAAEMWDYYNESSPELIYTGSSQCLCGIDPETVDAELGISSYNMGTNMQSFFNSYVAIRAAVEEKGVKTVVLCVDDEITEIDRKDNFRADASFRRARNGSTDLLTAVKETSSFLFDEPVLMHTGSVNFFFPWTYDRVSGIGTNLREKRDKQIYGETGHRLSTGREPSEDVLQLDSEVLNRETARLEENAVIDRDTRFLSADAKKELRKIASYCAENGIELIPITMPYPNVLKLYTIDSYKDTVKELTDLFDSYGFDYHNFNLAKPEFFKGELNEYKDTGHFNTAGAVRFSKVLAEYIKATKEERNAHFYTAEDF